MHANGTNFDFVAAVAAATLCLASSWALAQEGQATINPSSISLDEAAELELPAEAGTSLAPPAVPGLAFQPVGQSSELTSVNGRVSQHTWALYQVSARQPGTYSIPVGGQTLTLTVSAAGGRPLAGAATQAGQSQAADGNDLGPIGFVRMRRPSRRFYVGEAIPVAFKAYFRPGTEVTLSALPTLSNPAFTVSDLSDKPAQSRQIVSGREYEVVTWNAIISGTMPGTYSGEVTLPITARYREESPSTGSGFDAPFANDPMASSLFKSMFGGAGFPSGFGAGFGGFGNPFGQVRERALTLRSPSDPLTLLSLPVAGRPPGFTGAVGHFDVSATLTPAAGTAFEPMSLRVEVSGQGNFDRVSLSGLEPSRDFKTYPATSSFVPRTSRSTFSGTKAFVEPIVPERAGQLEVPAVTFSYFDPKPAAYVTASTLPLRASIAPASAATPSPAVTAAPAAETTASPDGLRPDHDPAGETATLRPPERQPWFWLALGLPLLGLALALVLSRRTGPSGRARRRELQAQLAAQRQEMRLAVQRRDTRGFFDSARAALQAELSDRWSLPADQVTETEIRRRLGDKGALLADALNTAELLRYGAARFDPDSLPEFDASLERALDQMEVAS